MFQAMNLVPAPCRSYIKIYGCTQHGGLLTKPIFVPAGHRIVAPLMTNMYNLCVYVCNRFQLSDRCYACVIKQHHGRLSKSSAPFHTNPALLAAAQSLTDRRAGLSFLVSSGDRGQYLGSAQYRAAIMRARSSAPGNSKPANTSMGRGA